MLRVSLVFGVFMGFFCLDLVAQTAAFFFSTKPKTTCAINEVIFLHDRQGSLSAADFGPGQVKRVFKVDLDQQMMIEHGQTLHLDLRGSLHPRFTFDWHKIVCRGGYVFSCSGLGREWVQWFIDGSLSLYNTISGFRTMGVHKAMNYTVITI